MIKTTYERRFLDAARIEINSSTKNEGFDLNDQTLDAVEDYKKRFMMYKKPQIAELYPNNGTF